MAAVGASGEVEDAQRCRVCDADVLFLATCPACGTPTRADTPLAVVPAPSKQDDLSDERSAETIRLSFAEAARARAKAHAPLPQELLRAWQPVPDRSQPAAKPDEWLSATRRGRVKGQAKLSSKRRNWLIGLAVLAVVAIGTPLGLKEFSANNAQHKLSAPALIPEQTYTPGGYPISARFPTVPSVVRVPLSLAGSSYTATIYTSTSGSTAVTIGVYPFPIGKLTTTSPAAFLRGFIKGGAISTAHLHDGGQTVVEGLPAARLAATIHGGTLADFGVMVLDGHYAVEVLASGPATTVDKTFQQVMSNFRIDEPQKGIVSF